MRVLDAGHIGELGQPTKNNFEIVIPGYDITLAVKNAPIPKMVTDKTENHYGNGVTFTAGKTKPEGDWDISLRQFLEADNVATLVYWRSLVYNPVTRAVGKPSEYKVDEVYIYKYDGSGNQIEKWIVEGVFPLSVGVGDGDYESGDPCEVTLSLSYDQVYRSDVSSVAPVSL